MNHHFDVVVAGAGPAGLSAGLSAVQGGASTLLVERKKEIGLPVRCGELFPSLDEAQKLWPDAHLFRSFYELLPKEAISNRIRKMRLISPRNSIFEFDFEGYVLKRDLFEKRFSEEVEKRGAEIHLSSRVEEISEKHTTKKVLMTGPSGETFAECKILIGADGFPSKTARNMNMKHGFKPQDMAFCVQMKMKNARIPQEDTVEIYFTNYALGGYAWIIPKGEGEANVGLGVRISDMPRKSFFTRCLSAFTEKHPIASKRLSEAKSMSQIGKFLPVGGLAKNICSNGTLLVGDAAGTVIADNGSGILTAMMSGHIAGKFAVGNMKAHCKLSSYPEAIQRDLGTVLQRGYLYRRIGDKLVHSETFFDAVFHVLTRRNLAKIICCEPMWPLSIISDLNERGIGLQI